MLETELSRVDIEESMIGVRLEQRKELGMNTGETTSSRSRDECEHLVDAPVAPEVTDLRCEDCVREGTEWVHLRTCLACGHVGCCDSSPRRHASAHHAESSHPVIASAEPGESWRWCFVDELVG